MSIGVRHSGRPYAMQWTSFAHDSQNLQWPQETRTRRDSRGWMRLTSHSCAWSSDCAAGGSSCGSAAAASPSVSSSDSEELSTSHIARRHGRQRCDLLRWEIAYVCRHHCRTWKCMSWFVRQDTLNSAQTTLLVQICAKYL